MLRVNSVLAEGCVVPIGWIAAGDPAQLFSPDQHDELWAVRQDLDCPGTVYGVPRTTSMREIMAGQCAAHGLKPNGDPAPTNCGAEFPAG